MMGGCIEARNWLSPARTPAGSARQRRRQRRNLSSQAALTIQLDGAVVVAPERRSPKGIVHFLGGAFAGAVPHLAYSLLLERLADGGYTCVTTPYAVTFQHVSCAQDVHARFEGALAQLRGSGSSRGSGSGAPPRGAWAVPPDVPVHGVGHSNGALLHLLIGALCLAPAPAPAPAPALATAGTGGSSAGGSRWPSRASNVLISFNNRQVAEAVPLPLGALPPAVQQLRGQGRLATAAQEGLQQAAAAAAQLVALSGEAAAVAVGPVAAEPLRRQQQLLLAGLQQWDPALVQLGSVFDEVGDGFLDFSPTPAEARQIIADGYSVPRTLLIQFTDDSIDQTPEAAAMLRQRRQAQRGGGASGGEGGYNAGAGAGAGVRVGPTGVASLRLPGSHVTPCGGDLGWPVLPQRGAAFGPGDALAMAAKAALQADTQQLADRVLDYLDSQGA